VRYQEIPPPARLRGLVEGLWTLESDGSDAAPQRVVPDGHPELILNAGRPFEALEDGEWRGQPRLFLAGQIEGPLLLRPGGPARILGIRFHPHGAAALFGPRMHELSSRFTSVDDLSPALLRGLDQAVESGFPIARVEAALVVAQARLRAPDRLVEEAVRRLLAAPQADIAVLARSLGISLRHLERRFRATVGLPPKLFGRMRRFLRVFRMMEQWSATWVDAAIECGYYDQAHLIRDFRRFSGQTPAVLLARDADLARHFLERFGVSHSYNTAAGRAV
jgi:methylphosphotriester-DNA--protein-cysteine methyltransferase